MPKPDKEGTVEYHFHLHQGDSDELTRAVTDLANVVQGAMPTIINSVNQLREQVQSLEARVATDLTSIRTEVNEAKTVLAGAKALIEGLYQALLDALAGENLTEDVKAIADDLGASVDELAAAVDNVPVPDNTLPGDLPPE
jgi:restriction endonuclease Mrr